MTDVEVRGGGVCVVILSIIKSRLRETATGVSELIEDKVSSLAPRSFPLFLLQRKASPHVSALFFSRGTTYSSKYFYAVHGVGGLCGSGDAPCVHSSTKGEVSGRMCFLRGGEFTCFSREVWLQEQARFGCV